MTANPTKSILIIEDNAAILESMKDTLEIQGYTVFTAANGKVGLEKLASMTTLPFVILLDLMMPVLNGWGFLNFRKTGLFAHIPVVICSAYENSARSIKGHEVLIKPLQLSELIKTISLFTSQQK